MHRFYLPASECRTPLLMLKGREAHHAMHVLRIARGESVTILNGNGGEYLCDVLDSHGDVVTLKARQQSTAPPLPYELTLFQAVPKGKLMETIIQKATELGAARIVPVLSDRVVPNLGDTETAEHKLQKWQLVAIEAIKQSGQPWLPHVEPPSPLKNVLAGQNKPELCLLASLQPGARHPRHYFDEFRSLHGRSPKTIGLWIGPEGDFTPAEMAEIKAAGAFPISLGRLVLRVETAAIYAMSVCNYELQA